MARMGPGGLRGAIAGEAARLMYEEGVKQYFTAKRLAAKRDSNMASDGSAAADLAGAISRTIRSTWLSRRARGRDASAVAWGATGGETTCGGATGGGASGNGAVRAG